MSKFSNKLLYKMIIAKYPNFSLSTKLYYYQNPGNSSFAVRCITFLFRFWTSSNQNRRRR